MHILSVLEANGKQCEGGPFFSTCGNAVELRLRHPVEKLFKENLLRSIVIRYDVIKTTGDKNMSCSIGHLVWTYIFSGSIPILKTSGGKMLPEFLVSKISTVMSLGFFGCGEKTCVGQILARIYFSLKF